MNLSQNKNVVVVTGGAGFIGSNLCDKLIEGGSKVICIDNLDNFYDVSQKKKNIAKLLKSQNFNFIKKDIRDRNSIKTIFKKYNPNRVVHLAGLAGVRNSVANASHYADVNLNGTISIMDAAKETGVANLILASTSSVYGNNVVLPFKEYFVTDRPLSPYSASKKSAEVMAYSYHNLFKMNITCLRFFTAYGPRVRPDMMSYKVMDSIYKNKEIIMFDNPNMSRDWTYIDDVCDGIILALDKTLGYEIINIGRGQSILLADFISRIENIIGRKARIKKIPTPETEPAKTLASIKKAGSMLGYRPNISINEGLTMTFEWYKSLNK